MKCNTINWSNATFAFHKLIEDIFSNAHQWIEKGVGQGIRTPTPGNTQVAIMGVQWRSCRVLDSRPKGRGFEPHRHHNEQEH